MTTITRDTTEAMMGRSMKTWEVTRHPCFGCSEGDAGGGGASPRGTALTGAPGPIFINPLTTAVAGFDALIDEPLIALPDRGLNRPHLDVFVGPHDVNKRALRTLEHGALRDQHDIGFSVSFKFHFHELPWQELPLWIGNRDSHDTRTGFRAEPGSIRSSTPSCG